MIVLRYLPSGRLAMPLVHPCTVMFSGPTGSGKTYGVIDMLRHFLIFPPPERIVLVYGEAQQHAYQDLKRLYPNIEMYSAIDDVLYDSFNNNVRNLLILDDQMDNAKDSPIVSRIFTQGSHHRNLTVVFLTQNLFAQGKSMRTINLNTQYIVLFKSPRDKNQIGCLGMQIYQSDKQFFLDAYTDATREPYHYLVIDLQPGSREEFRLRSCISPSQGPYMVIYGIREEANQRYKRMRTSGLPANQFVANGPHIPWPQGKDEGTRLEFKTYEVMEPT